MNNTTKALLETVVMFVVAFVIVGLLCVVPMLILLTFNDRNLTETCKGRFGQDWYYSGSSTYKEAYCVNRVTGERKFV